MEREITREKPITNFQHLNLAQRKASNQINKSWKLWSICFEKVFFWKQKYGYKICFRFTHKTLNFLFCFLPQLSKSNTYKLVLF
jgi:hypothetical protein